MADTLRHRGPDDHGAYCEPDTGLALGHRRLSVIDLSAHGHQPMISASGRYVMVFNGEVYNHTGLRAELEKSGAVFRGHCDTEVMLAAIEQWGLEAALQRFNGMFAIALWDREQRVLSLVRDRVGIKPLYYGWSAGTFVFASELKAIAALPGFASPVDRDALCLFLRYSYVPAPHSIYQGLSKLAPGTLLRVNAALARAQPDDWAQSASARIFWSARGIAEAGVAQPHGLSDAEAVRELDRVLRNAVATRMEADVPLGAFLSGGVDSSTVVALMQSQSTRPVQTFSIGFQDRTYDEAVHAKVVAAHLGTDHHELYVTPKDALDVVPMLPTMYDEPFADSSQIPTCLVSRMARQSVTVALSGDGGDELFAGYGRYLWNRRLSRWMNRMPLRWRLGLAASLRSHENAFGAAFETINRFLPASLRMRNARIKVEVLASLLGAQSDDDRYCQLLSQWRFPSAVVRGGREPATTPIDAGDGAALTDPIARAMLADLLVRLPDDMLTKVDRASMACSLEVRVPILDHRVVEFAWRTPMTQKVRDGKGKWLLRQVLYNYVPREIIDRPKMGFKVPIAGWLRGELRDWAESLLDEKRLREEGYFDPAVIRSMWDQHVAGAVKEHHRLWDVLMFQAWLSASKV